MQPDYYKKNIEKARFRGTGTRFLYSAYEIALKTPGLPEANSTTKN